MCVDYSFHLNYLAINSEKLINTLMKTTRESSQVVFGLLKPDEVIHFTKKAVEVYYWLPCTKYKSNQRMDRKLVWKKLVLKMIQL